jgi:8-oxo-dGTP pyrophosphatase MutT (NUDIX family)
MPKPSATVVVVDGRQRVLLLWRHRFITDTWGWEVPAGWAEEGEDIAETARREVEEETGWRPGPLTALTSYFALPGISDQHFTVFRAAGATYLGKASDTSEAAHVKWVPMGEVAGLIAQGELTDGPSLTALSLAMALERTSP